MTEEEELKKERDNWCLEAVWVKLHIIKKNMDKLTFEGSGDVYDMITKCQKIIIKALNMKGAKSG